MTYLLIERKSGLLFQSFLSQDILSPFEFLIFLVAVAIIDLAFLQLMLVAFRVANVVFRIDDRRFTAIYITISLGVIVSLNTLQYGIIAYLGDLARTQAAVHAGGGLGGAIPYVLDVLPAFLLPCVLIGMTVLGFGIIVNRLLGRVQVFPPRKLRYAVYCGLAAVLVQCSLVFAWLPQPVVVQVRRACLQPVVSKPLRMATDFDNDGIGLLDFPSDFACFDGRRHPFALEIPANGIDENGLGGDLIVYQSPELPRQLGEVKTRPDIILIIACSLREDVVYSTTQTPSVMPHLEAFARQGFKCRHAYSHTGVTFSSVQAALTGSLIPSGGSLMRDLKDVGYQTVTVSVHDESFGHTRDVCALHESDHYFDASYDPGARVTAYSNPSSMILSGDRIVEESEAILKELDPDSPLFMYAYFATTHFPYSHDCARVIQPHKVLKRSEMHAGNQEALLAMYRNAAANLDLQIAGLVEKVQEYREREPPVFIIIGDHGESLFDDGMLGHGRAANDVQTKVPFVVLNGWGSIPIPFGHLDLRPWIHGMLTSPRPERPVLSTVPAERPLLQVIGKFTYPLELASVTLKDRSVIDMRNRVVRMPDGASLAIDALGQDDPALELLHRWECYQIASEQQ